jgi:ribosomal-protein-alanine N-acetyltransferase
VARAEGFDGIIAYGGIWLMVDEAHITTFAVDPGWRRQGVGEALLLALLDLAQARHAREATLEVRLSNLPARRLYEKYGFRPVGLRPHYYSDNGEDALIMTTEPLGSVAMRRRIDGLRAALAAAPPPAGPTDVPDPRRDDGTVGGLVGSQEEPPRPAGRER